MRTLKEFRAAIGEATGGHLNNAGVAPLSAPARDAIGACADRMRMGSAGIGAALDAYEDDRKSVAALVGAAAGDVAMVQTCAVAISTVAAGFPFRAGDEIVTLEQEYPSNAYPWLRAAERSGARVVRVPSNARFEIDHDRLVDAIGPKTRVVAVSWVQFSTGEMVDLVALSEACRRHDAWLVVDAIQGIGVLPFDLHAFGVDVVCGGTHKWLCGPLGHGFWRSHRGVATSSRR